MKTVKTILPVFALIVLTLFTACKNDNDLPDVPPPDPNEMEVITTITLTFTDSAAVAPEVTATFRDPDGDGGDGPDIFDDIVLQSNTTYNCAITLLNETVTPAEDITSEILAEADEHFFCMTPGGAFDVTMEATDSDGAFPIGLASKWWTGAPSTGTAQIILKHQPDGAKDGTCSPGETDIEVQFIAEVQ